MTNKRITELTALDGDDVADNDVLAIVDVSDTTMAASGTTKKITVAELVTDSALTNKFWPNSSTALTGANLANGDKLAVVDVGSPDVPKYITADELAQGSQFTSRYAPKAGETLWLSPFAGFLEGAPGSNASAGEGLLLDASTNEGFWHSTVLPTYWATFDIDVYWTNAGAGAGDVVWYCTVYARGDGQAYNDYTATPSTSGITAPTAGNLKITRLPQTIPVSAGDLLTFALVRFATNAGDTLANDCRLYGINLVRAS